MPASHARSFASDPHWTSELIAELEAGKRNGRVGQPLVSETDRVRVWLLAMRPGERLPFHTHVLDCFWCATSACRARARDAPPAGRDYQDFAGNPFAICRIGLKTSRI
jgi:beta-alanine degradation protein BauB